MIFPLVVAAGLGMLVAPQAQAASNNWKCTSKSWKSATDRGGRDAKVILRHPRDSTNHFALNWKSEGEHMYAANASTMRNAEFSAVFEGTGRDWYWLLQPGEAIHDNLDLPEGHTTLITASSPPANVGSCNNNHART
ncbi:hypothetical protein ACH4D5_11080 [Streptomyces sp. NPDC018029]|uniref:hypothetical protein n=1 Tax=Streptomyces sp. NPDC018029 TaxID=3365032 RepID=UPI0037938099